MEENMKLAFSLDDKCGVAFLKRRLSRDKLLIEDFAALAGDEAVYIEPYSEELFEEAQLNLICSSSPAEKAEQGDYVFLERINPAPLFEKAEQIIIYRWNRAYPSDTKLTAKPEDFGFRLVTSHDFSGNSHERITREIYRK